VITLAMMIFTTTAAVLSGLRTAPDAFAANEGFVISSSSAPTIFSSQVEMSMVDALDGLVQITGASPEVFAFSSWGSESFVLRGVVLERLNETGPTFKKFELAGTDSPGERSSALIGTRLHERLGIQLPYTIPIVGSYSSRMELLNVVGSFKTDSPLDDELLVSLDVARFLSGMSSDKVSIIRVSTSDPEWLSSLLSPEGPRFTLFDLLSQRAYAAIGEEVGVSVGVRNWGTERGSVNISFAEGDEQIAEAERTLNASESDRVSQVISFDSLGQHAIEVSISGEFPVKLTTYITIVEPYLRIAAPSKAALGDDISFRVTTFLGEPAVGATVTFGSQVNTTDTSGDASFVANQIGAIQAAANMTGFLDAQATVTVVDPSAYPPVFQPSVLSFTLSPERIKETESATGVIVVSNNGTIAGTYNVTVFVDLVIYTTLNISLDALESKSISFKIDDLSTGSHTVQVASFATEIAVEPWFADNPDYVKLVMRYSGSSSLFSAGSIPIYQAAKISEGNVSVALFAIGATSALLALLAITSVFSKEIHEGRRRLGILKTIGASRSAIRKLVFPQALENSLGGAALGIAFGVIISDALSRSGVFFLFGHEFHLSLNAGLLILLLLGAVAISVSSALASTMMAVRETTIRSIRKLEEEEPEPIDVEKLIADE